MAAARESLDQLRPALLRAAGRSTDTTARPAALRPVRRPAGLSLGRLDPVGEERLAAAAWHLVGSERQREDSDSRQLRHLLCAHTGTGAGGRWRTLARLR